MPDPVCIGGNLLHASAAEHAVRAVLCNLSIPSEASKGVRLLDEQPALVIPVFRAPCAYQGPAAVEFLALEFELEMPLLVGLPRIRLRRPSSAIPHHDRPSAVFLGRDNALELSILERMILDVHRQALVVGIEARSLRHCPAQQHAIELETEVVVHTPRGVLLNDEAERAGAPLLHLPARLRCHPEVALLPITLESHGMSQNGNKPSLSTEAKRVFS